MKKKGIFISFEGIEGTGKTTQARLLAERLKDLGYDVVLTKEPGGTAIGHKIREILLEPKYKEMFHITELLLYSADRAQHLKELILPKIEEGKIVITDRFVDSTTAYQGYGRGLSISVIKAIDEIATGSYIPDLTILLDIDVEIGLKRNIGANKADRLELEDIEFHKKVRNGYLQIAKKEPERVKIIDAAGSVEHIAKNVWEIVKWRLRI